MTDIAPATPSTTARFELAIPIAAPRATVWQLLCERPDDWWIGDLRCVGPDSRVVLQPHAGGTLTEQSASGGSLLWFTVLAIEPERSLNLGGSIAPPFGGPCQTFLLLQLEDRDDGTLLRVTNSLHGHLTEAALQEMRSGWQLLFDRGLKALAER